MLGTPSKAYMKLFNASKAAFDLATSILKPGLRIDELDARLRAEVARSGYAYPHHSGHSLGTDVHEWPRLVPYETARLEENMVVMVEPGAYDAEIGGVRLEWMFLITATGCRSVTDFQHLPSIP